MDSGRCPVVFSKLSKLLHQEYALSAPCLQHFRNSCGAIKIARCGFPAYAVISALRRRPRRAQECCGQTDPSILMSHCWLQSPDVIRPTGADAIPVVGGGCKRVELTGATPSRAVVEDGADVLISTSTVVRFLGGVHSEKKLFWQPWRRSVTSPSRKEVPADVAAPWPSSNVEAPVLDHEQGEAACRLL
jgi:hypothetical protein